MKKLIRSSIISKNKKIACTISAAALMLGVSSAATVGLHFQENYCGSASYSGFPVTLPAFGIESNGWENLIPMQTGYGSCDNQVYYTLNQIIDSTTSTNGLNPLPSGSLDVTWGGNGANFSGFAGYNNTTLAPPPGYGYDGHPPIPIPTGEWQIYSTFVRDGVNYGVTNSSGNGSGGDNDQPGYMVDITGLKSVFPSNSFVVELIAASDSMQFLTNAFIIDATANVTNSTVDYPRTPFPFHNESGLPWYRGHGGGLSTVSGVLDTDHVQIMGNRAAHGANGSPNGYDNASTISGFILTDKPVVSMYPQSIPVAGPGDSINLSAYIIGVPPLSYQWTWNGAVIPGATNMAYSISNVNLSAGGNYAIVASNAYGMATSKVSSVTVDQLVQDPATNLVFDSNPINPQNNGVNMGATWEAASSDGTVTQDGVMSFTAAESNGVTVADSPSLNGATGTVSFWMRSTGTDQGSPGTVGASLFCRITGNNSDDFVLVQNDNSGNLYFQGPNSSANTFASNKGVSDGKWHFVALTFDQSASGGAAIYIDGSVDNTNANGGSWSWTTGQPLEIGYTTDPTFREYNGEMDDVRYYGTNLTASQISTIFTTSTLVDTNDLHMQLNFTTAPGNGFFLNWLESSAVLQSAPSLQGPWSDLPGVVSPYPIIPSASQQFFRYIYVPQALVSNPYLM